MLHWYGHILRIEEEKKVKQTMKMEVSSEVLRKNKTKNVVDG